MLAFYRKFCRFEEILTSAIFVSIVGLIFLAAFFRAFSHPLVWADDIAKFLFSWAAFLGADIALRHSRLVGVDMLVKKFPAKIVKISQILVFTIMITILVSFVYFGTRLSIMNWDRDFQTLSFMSYSMVTFSLPVASLLMIISSVTKLVRVVKNFGDDSYHIKKDIPSRPDENEEPFKGDL